MELDSYLGMNINAFIFCYIFNFFLLLLRFFVIFYYLVEIIFVFLIHAFSESRGGQFEQYFDTLTTLLDSTCR